MAKRKHSPLPFDKRGGVIVMLVRMINSASYSSLSTPAKAMLPYLQVHWRNDKPVDYGVREAMRRLCCSKATAIKVFHELQDLGFIELVDESLFSSRIQSKTRTWRLTWLPFDNKPPTNEWEKITSTGAIPIPVERYRYLK